MTRCYICGVSDEIVPNYQQTYKGKINGKPKRKTIRICNCCGAWLPYEDIREKFQKIVDGIKNKWRCGNYDDRREI